ncbi:hypothetical protein Hanom_Chr00s006700g01735381 [Helianthus anomalus]
MAYKYRVTPYRIHTPHLHLCPETTEPSLLLCNSLEETTPVAGNLRSPIAGNPQVFSFRSCAHLHISWTNFLLLILYQETQRNLR